MASWNISGTWIGEYSYDPSDAMPQVRIPVGFSFCADLGWFGRFRGSIQDDPVAGVTQVASVLGRVCGSSITFRKLYPEFYVTFRDRLVTIAEQLRETNGISLDEPPDPVPIWYRGTFNHEGQIVTGTWRIKGGLIPLRAYGRQFFCTTKTCTGAWQMRRQQLDARP